MRRTGEIARHFWSCRRSMFPLIQLSFLPPFRCKQWEAIRPYPSAPLVLHCKKRLAVFPSPCRDVTYYTYPAGDGKTTHLFLQCISAPALYCPHSISLKVQLSIQHSPFSALSDTRSFYPLNYPFFSLTLLLYLPTLPPCFSPSLIALRTYTLFPTLTFLSPSPLLAINPFL